MVNIDDWNTDTYFMEAKLPDVIYAIEQGKSLHVKDELGLTVLHYAIVCSTPDIILALIAAGADMNAQNVMGRRPFHGLALRNDAIMVGTLIVVARAMGKEIDINAPDKHGRTVFHESALRPNPSIMLELLEYGAKIDSVDNLGWTAAHFAAVEGRILILRALAKQKANMDALNKYKTTPMMEAAFHDKINSFQVLRNEFRCKMDLLTLDSRNILHLASIKAGVKMISAILEASWNVTIQDKEQGRVPLILAKDSQGYRPLDLAKQREISKSGVRRKTDRAVIDLLEKAQNNALKHRAKRK